MDRTGADPVKVCREMNEKLGLTTVPLQLNIGVGNDFVGVIDLITMKALYFEGDNGENQIQKDIPEELAGEAAQARQFMLEALSMHCDELLAALLDDQPVTPELIEQTIREATINREIVPVMMGSAYKNKGVQPLLDGVCRYLPSPLDRPIFARDHDNDGAEVMLASDPQAPLVAMAFKIVDETFGQLTYTRVYQGTLQKGKQYRNARTNKMQRVGRIVRMHANDRKDIEEALPGDIVAMVAVDCASGDTFCDEAVNYSLESIFVADPVIRLSLTPASSADQDKMGKALNRFM
jgi:elongation factor G